VNGHGIQGYLAVKTKQRAVPNIFIDQKHIGGNSDLPQLEKVGKLKPTLVAAGVLST